MNNTKITEVNAVCVLSQGNIKGYILFKEDLKNKRTLIICNLKNVPQGKHGFHIHEFGDLREGCKSLCSHFNPNNKNHGGPKDLVRHVGDLGNLEPDVNGNVNKKFHDKLIKLKGKNNIIGRSVVIHSKEDDLGKGNNDESLITGNAGKRIACGIIGFASN